jgi:hypothetical protein
LLIKKQREVHMSMRKWIVRGVVVAVLASFLGASSMAWADEMNKPTGTEVLFDLIIARPCGFMGLVAGTVIFVVSSPLAIVTGSAKNSADALVAEPYKFTFVRGLGEY